MRDDYNVRDVTQVFGFVYNGQAKAYPIQIMDHHELVNDTIAGKPITVGW